MRRAMSSRPATNTPAKKPAEADKPIVSLKTQKSLLALHDHALAETLRLATKNGLFTHSPIDDHAIDDENFSSIMFTVSSSDFRIIALLHFLKKEHLSPTQLDFVNAVANIDFQFYHDYIAELGNNFCGVICRTLNSANYSTGMSTPAVLTNKNVLHTFGKIGIDMACHKAADCDGQFNFCSSLCLISNDPLKLNLDIDVATDRATTEAQGELEFF
jgi:hypothetical protein